MLSLKPFGWLFVASLSLWQIALAKGINERFNEKRESLQKHLHLHQHAKRAASSSSSVPASSSFSSSSYVPSWPASSTFTVSQSSSYVSSHYVAPTPTPASCGSEDCKFYSSKTEPYFIAEWPDVDFETGEFYGGSTPVRIFCKPCFKQQSNANLIVCPGSDR